MSFQGSPQAPFPEAGQANIRLRRQRLVQIPGYDIECEIGRGGMATVYRAVQQSLGRRVAIKVLGHDLNDDGEFVERFKKEGRILAQLSHPNIVTIHDIGATQDDRLFLSIEYLSGGTLKEKIKPGLPVDSILHIIKAIAKALSCAHQNGVIHRDVKPSNIMFRHDGSPVLTDFGVARTTGANTVYTAAGLIVGSPGYISPEQATGERTTAQSDLYGLGVVFYEMLVSHPPYRADNSLAVILKHLNDPIPELPDQYRHFQPVLNRLLAKKAVDRYQNANEFLEAINLIAPDNTGTHPKIESIDNNQSIIEFVSGKIQRLSRKRTRTLLWSGITGLAVLVIAIGYSFKSPIKTTVYPQPSSESATPVKNPAPAPAPEKLKLDQEKEQQAAKLKAQKIEHERQQELQLQAQQLLIQAQSSFQENSLQITLAHIEQGLLAVPNHPGLLALREQVRTRIVEQQRQAEARQRQEEEAQRQAKLAERQKAEQARQQAEADQYLTRALDYQRTGKYAASLQQIEKGLAVIPSHEGLLQLKTQVTAQALAEQQEIARRQAEKAAKEAKAIKEKERAPRNQTRTSKPPAPPAGEEDATLKKLQSIRNSVDALDQSLGR